MKHLSIKAALLLGAAAAAGCGNMKQIKHHIPQAYIRIVIQNSHLILSNSLSIEI